MKLYIFLRSRSYFTLWLRDYTVKYNQWAASYKMQRDKAGDRVDWSVPSSSHLAMFYARAKQTFFMPNSEYELNLPSKFLAPFHASDGSLHPDPLIFTDVAVEAQKMLQESLRFFVQAQLNNVGNRRVICGVVAGTIAILTLGILPLVIAFTLGKSRWVRLTAFPGMFVGLAIAISALHGMCLGIYLLGDLRQLHKFELNRPPISKPRPLSTPRGCTASSHLVHPPSAGPIQPINQPPRMSIIPPPPAHMAERRCTSNSLSSQSSWNSSSAFTDETPVMGIEISNVMYDADIVDGPATNPIAPDSRFIFPPHKKDGSFATTATFIHPYEFNDDYDHKPLPEQGQALCSFDFDALPSRFHPQDHPPQYHNLAKVKLETSLPPQKSSKYPLQFLERFQEKCSVKWRAAETVATDIENQTLSWRSSSFGIHMQRPQEVPPHLADKEAALRKQWKMIKAVPTFTDLTHILSPVIARGQWEIVVKSAVIAFILSWVILGSLLAIPHH